MFKNYKLATKMYMAFGLSAAITLGVGVVGFRGLTKNDEAIHDIGDSRLPAVESVMTIKGEASEISTALSTLMDLGLEKSLRQQQQQAIAQSRESYEAAWKTYEALPHSPEETEQWKKLGGVWGQWRTANNNFMDLSHKIEVLDLGNPAELGAELETIRGAHYELISTVLEMLNNGKVFEGGDNHETCKLGKWFASFKTTNPEVQQLQQSLHEPHRKFHQGIKQLKTLVAGGRSDEAKSVYAALTDDMKATLGKLDQLLLQAENAHNLQHQAEHQLVVEARTHQATANDLLDTIIKHNSSTAHGTTATAGNNAKTLKTTMMAAAFTGLAFAAAMAFLVTRAITTPLIKAVGVADELSKGNLTVNIKADRKDETGQLLNAMGTMAGSLRTMFTDISKGVETLASSSSELAAVSQQLSSAAGDTAKKSNGVASASEEMSISIQSVSAAMEQSTSNINMIASSTEEMTVTVNEIAESAEKARVISEGAVKQSQATSVKMTELGESAKKIGRVTETITEISEQTNLLALNATIEAARAGEAGKGFAVVANEIKELARQTAAATVDIKNQIEEMQSTTGDTIEDIVKISDVIAEINTVIQGIATSVEEQSAATNEIASNIAQASQGIAEVNENVAQSTVVVNDITRDVNAISSQSNEVGAGSTQVQASSQTLSGLAGQLEQLVKKFKV